MKLSHIQQMGKLFSEMTSLVMEQSEVIGRIEDDVEAGFEDTKVAYSLITSTYEITKGNRSIIIKIFLLLIIFAVIFLVFT